MTDEATLAKYRTQTCAWCGKRAPSQPHHALVRRGHGGGLRLDIDENLLPLCFACHHGAHEGRLPGMATVDHAAVRQVLLTLIAHREGKTPEEIEETITKAVWHHQ